MPVVRDRAVDLQGRPVCVDTDSMLNAEAEILALDAAALLLLQTYRTDCLAARAERTRAIAEATRQTDADETHIVDSAATANTFAADATAEEQARSVPFEVEKSDPWVPRVNELPDVEAARLPELHGKLIAAGFITFQIRDRTSGVEYRVANAGKQFLSQQLSTDDDEQTAETLHTRVPDAEFNASPAA